MDENLETKNKHVIVEEDFQAFLDVYPTLGSAEKGLKILVDKQKQVKNSVISNIFEYEAYNAELCHLENEMFMLEEVITFHKNNFQPLGVKHADFNLYTYFESNSGTWLCTDIGKRTIVAIPFDINTENNFPGPPYYRQEIVFDENDFGGLNILEKDFDFKKYCCNRK